MCSASFRLNALTPFKLVLVRHLQERFVCVCSTVDTPWDIATDLGKRSRDAALSSQPNKKKEQEYVSKNVENLLKRTLNLQIGLSWIQIWCYSLRAFTRLIENDKTTQRFDKGSTQTSSWATKMKPITHTIWIVKAKRMSEALGGGGGKWAVQ